MRTLKSLLLLFLLVSITQLILNAQTKNPGLYDPSLDAKSEIKKAVKQARDEGKHVLLQIGGNW